jgi:hypothetical protein
MKGYDRKVTVGKAQVMEKFEDKQSIDDVVSFLTYL